jgi:hypothetical protein
MKVGSRRSFLKSSGQGFDQNAAAYFAFANVTDQTEQEAVNSLIINLKAGSLWNSFERIFLISPTSEFASLTCCKTLNQMTNVNSVSWSTSGFAPDYSTNYLDSEFSFDEDQTVSSWENAATGAWVSNTAQISASNSLNLVGGQNGTTFLMRASSNTTSRRFQILGPVANRSATNSFTSGFTFTGHIHARVFGISNREIYLDGVRIATNGNAAIIGSPRSLIPNLFLGANNISGTPNYGSAVTAPVFTLFWIARAFDSTEMGSVHSLFDQYQTAIGR